MIPDYFKLALKNLRQRKVRSVLTIVGILVAVMTIFVLMSLSLGLNEAVKEQFELLGTDKFFIQPKGQAGAPGTGGAVELTTDDVDIMKKVRGVETVAYFTIGNAKIEYKDKARYYYAIGIPLKESSAVEMIFEASDISMDEGRELRDGDSGKIMVGYNYKYKNLFNKPISVGNKIFINGREFDVIGIVGQIGNPSDDQQVYIAEEDFKELFNSGDRVDVIYVQIKQGEDIKIVSERAEKRLIDFRNVDEKTIDFTISTPEEILASFNTILSILTSFLVGIGAISLLVGGIGIANTMYTSVLERSKEIGTMKAIGARNRDILFIFVIESGVLGLVGGVIGLILGIVIAKTIEYIAQIYIGSDLLRASMNLGIIIGSLLFAFLIGVISGILPSLQASKLKPVDTLRYE